MSWTSDIFVPQFVRCEKGEHEFRLLSNGAQACWCCRLVAPPHDEWFDPAAADIRDAQLEANRVEFEASGGMSDNERDLHSREREG